MNKFLSIFVILSLCLILSMAFEDQMNLSSLKMKKNKAKVETESETKTECGGDFKFLATPFNKMFTFNNGNLQNTGPIPGVPTCGTISFIIGSVNSKSANKDHVNWLLGDIQTVSSWNTNAFTLWTWWDDGGITPALNFGGKLIAVTQPGEKDNFTSFYGIWRFVMIPVKPNGSFDIIPNGFSNIVDYIGFNLIAYV